jgi:hypothetical protein
MNTTDGRHTPKLSILRTTAAFRAKGTADAEEAFGDAFEAVLCALLMCAAVAGVAWFGVEAVRTATVVKGIETWVKTDGAKPQPGVGMVHSGG